MITLLYYYNIDNTIRLELFSLTKVSATIHVDLRHAAGVHSNSIYCQTFSQIYKTYFVRHILLDFKAILSKSVINILS